MSIVQSISRPSAPAPPTTLTDMTASGHNLTNNIADVATWNKIPLDKFVPPSRRTCS